MNRVVAIKVSAAQFSHRFEHEAKAIAALNHPHICQIHDVGPNYLVMEYVEGSPVVVPGQHGMAVARTLELGMQIASAIEAAHRKGIVHRDLKPANILVTAEGVAKLLDFGLAKQTTENILGAGGDLTLSATRTGNDPGDSGLYVSRAG